MRFINIEIKARCFHPEKVEAFLFANNAHFTGTDRQRDTYFNIPSGRLKLRRGNIENNLIFYRRADQTGPKESECTLAPVENGEKLELVLASALGIKAIVEKKRKIFYLGNVKVHIDEVPDLGSFVEIEASNRFDSTCSRQQLKQQCEALMQALEIKAEDLVENSYADMLMDKSG